MFPYLKETEVCKDKGIKIISLLPHASFVLSCWFHWKVMWNLHRPFLILFIPCIIFTINHIHQQMHIRGLQTYRSFKNSYMFRRQAAISRESQIQRNTRTNTYINLRSTLPSIKIFKTLAYKIYKMIKYLCIFHHFITLYFIISYILTFYIRVS
jgi:hypothetical protein